MTAIRLFTAASILQGAIAFGHVIGHFAMPRPANETEARLLEFMTTYHKQIAGGSMTILNSYDGLNIIYALFFAFASLVNLNIRRADLTFIKRISVINALVMATGFIIACVYFFWIPMAYFSLCFLIFLMAWLRAKT